MHFILLFAFLLAKLISSQKLNSTEIECIPNDNCLSLKLDDISRVAFNNSSLYMKRSCYCDENCFKYNDCCPDLALKNKFKVKSLQNLTCTLEKEICASEADTNYIYSIGGCPSNYKNEEIRSKCKNTSDIFLKWPFYSTKSNLTYNNLFCAICNRENRTYLQPWHAAFRCENNVNKQITKSNIKEFYYQMEDIKKSVYL